MPVLDLSISIRSRDMDYVRNQLASMPDKIQKATANALNTAMESGRKYIAKQLSRKVTAPQGRIIKDIRIVKAGPGRPYAAVTFYGRPVGALQFNARVFAPRKGGVQYKASKGESFVKFPHGFRGVGIGREGSGNAHLWIRERSWGKKIVGSKAHHKPNIGRKMEIIRPIYGPKMVTVWLRHPQIKQEASRRTNRILYQRLLSQVDRLLKRKKADRPDFAPTFDEE